MNTNIVIGIVAAIVVLGLWFWFSSKKKKAAAATEVTEVTEQETPAAEENGPDLQKALEAPPAQKQETEAVDKKSA